MERAILIITVAVVLIFQKEPIWAQPDHCDAPMLELSALVKTYETAPTAAIKKLEAQKLLGKANQILTLFPQQCINNIEYGNNPKYKISIDYKYAYLYNYANDVELSVAYFQKVCKNPLSKVEFTSPGRTFFDSANDILKYYSLVNTRGNTIEYFKGKIHSIDDCHLLVTDSLPYFLFEIEELSRKKYAIQDSTAAIEWGKENADREPQYYFRSPYLIVSKQYFDRPGDTLSRELRTQECNYNYDNREQVNPEMAYRGQIVPFTDYLYQDYFQKNSQKNIITVYLVSKAVNDVNYFNFSEFCRQLHYRASNSRVGYYNNFDNSIVFWVPSGWGSLNHELTHALMSDDFPGAPYWLSEGMAALHKEMKNNRPLDNHRLQAIKRSVKATRKFFSIAELLSPTDSFHNQLLTDAYSRYFCFFLSDSDKLSAIYRKMRENGGQLSDSLQTAIIMAAFDNKSMIEIQQEWEHWLSSRTIPDKWDRFTYSSSVNFKAITFRSSMTLPEEKLNDFISDANLNEQTW